MLGVRLTQPVGYGVQHSNRMTLRHRVAANAMACPGCVSGYFDVGEPKGKELTVAELPSYVCSPATPNGHAIVIATDIFGYK
jgi:hypothetical protein